MRDYSIRRCTQEKKVWLRLGKFPYSSSISFTQTLGDQFSITICDIAAQHNTIEYNIK